MSCLSGTVCTAIGQDAGFVDGWNPLAERYSGPAAPAPPVGMAAPVIQGQPAVGNYLRCAEGVWDGVPPVKFAYQWIDGGGRTVSSAPVYKVGSKEAGNTLTCQVTARDVAGSTVVASAPVTVS